MMCPNVIFNASFFSVFCLFVCLLLCLFFHIKPKTYKIFYTSYFEYIYSFILGLFSVCQMLFPYLKSLFYPIITSVGATLFRSVCSLVNYVKTRFVLLVYFYTPENIRKPVIFSYFQGNTELPVTLKVK